MSSLHSVDYFTEALCQLQHVAVFEDKNVGFRYTHRLRDVAMSYQMAIFAVDRHEEPGIDQVQHHFQLFLTGVAMNVYHRVAAVKDFGSFAVQIVYRLGYHGLVARNRGC